MTPVGGPNVQPWPCACSRVSQEARKHPSPRGSARAPLKQRDGRRIRLSLQISRELHVGRSQEHQLQLDGLLCFGRWPAGSLSCAASPELLQGALLQPRAPARWSSPAQKALAQQQRSGMSAQHLPINEKLNTPHIALVLGLFSGCFLTIFRLSPCWLDNGQPSALQAQDNKFRKLFQRKSISSQIKCRVFALALFSPFLSDNLPVQTKRGELCTISRIFNMTHSPYAITENL